MNTFVIVTELDTYEINARTFPAALEILNDKHGDDSCIDSVETI